MLRFIIADDHPILLKGLKEIILENFHDAVIDEAGRGSEVIDKVGDNEYDLALLDISLPDIDGLEVLERIKKRRPKLPVLLTSTYPEEAYALRAIKAGGNGYITKESASDELGPALRKILAGKRYISPALAEAMLFDTDSGNDKQRHETLSERELQVACLIGKGRTIKEITEELHLSVNTVRTYRVRILHKIGVKGTSQLIHYFVKHRLVE